MEYIIAFIIDILIYGVSLWGAAKLTGVTVTLKDMITISVLVSGASFIPYVGWLVAILVLFWLLQMATDVELFPDLILMFLVSNLFYWVLFWGIYHEIDKLTS